MKLDWAILANHAEIQGNLAYINGGGIDAIHAAALPTAFIGTLLLRFLLHPVESDRTHMVEVRIVTEDGASVGPDIKGEIPIVKPPPNMPPLPKGWNYPVFLPIQLIGLTFSREGNYSIELLADGTHVGSIPFKVVVATGG